MTFYKQPIQIRDIQFNIKKTGSSLKRKIIFQRKRQFNCLNYQSDSSCKEEISWQVFEY